MGTVAEMVRAARRRTELTPQQCAQRAGYENVDKGANRLLAIEQGRNRFPDEEVWGRFADVLGLDPEEVAVRIAEDFEKVRSIHVQPYVVVKPFAGFYYRQEAPAGLSGDELVDFARDLAAADRVQTCVVFGPARCLFIKPDGKSFQSDRPPFMRLA